MKFLLSGKLEITFYWVLAIPFAGFAAFLWDGIFIGATATRQMFLCNAGSLSRFLPRLLLLTRVDGKSCPLAGFHRLLISARHRTGSFK